MPKKFLSVGSCTKILAVATCYILSPSDDICSLFCDTGLAAAIFLPFAKQTKDMNFKNNGASLTLPTQGVKRASIHLHVTRASVINFANHILPTGFKVVTITDLLYQVAFIFLGLGILIYPLLILAAVCVYFAHKYDEKGEKNDE